MTTADRRKVLDLLAEGKISADEAERLLKALDRQRPDGPNIASMVDEGVNMVTNAVERLSVDIDDVFEGSSFEHDSRKFTVQSEPRIEVTNFSGRVEIRGGGAEGEVQVDADVPHSDRVRYSVRQDGDTIRVEARPAGRRSLFGCCPSTREHTSRFPYLAARNWISTTPTAGFRSAISQAQDPSELPTAALSPRS